MICNKYCVFDTEYCVVDTQSYFQTIMSCMGTFVGGNPA